MKSRWAKFRSRRSFITFSEEASTSYSIRLNSKRFFSVS
jgi:hypothetical protein